MSIVNEINYFYYRMSLYELQFSNNHDSYGGLSYNSQLYLNVIDQMETCTVSKVAEAIHVTKSAVTLKVNELVKQGHVVKTQSETDRRIFYLELSPPMRESMNIYHEVLTKTERELKKHYTKEQLKTFEEVLHSISGYDWRTL